jgi:glucose-6-phosphate isomerase
MIKTDLSGVMPFLDDRELPLGEGRRMLDDLFAGRLPYAETGWMNLPYDFDEGTSAIVKDAARKITSDSKALVVVGIGGSYLGARAALDFLKTPQYNQLDKDTPNIYFVGNDLSGEHLAQVIAFVEDKDFSVNYISKSGSTIEPAIAFRIFKELLSSKYGEAEASKRIYVTTDAAKGNLCQLANREGYRSFCIPDTVGGRYSVLTAVGLLPAMCAGIDIDAVIAGAREASEADQTNALTYACARQALYRKGKLRNPLVL